MSSLEYKADQKLLDARCRLITKDPWFGTFAANFTWISDDGISTLGVIMKSLSRIECRYNPEFINKLSMTSNMAAVEHELMHIILLHLTRCGSRNRRLWNISTDMIINGRYDDPEIKHLKDIEDEAAETDDQGNVIPFKLIWYPKDWPNNLTSEEVYERLEQCKVVVRIPAGGSGGEGDSGSGNSQDGQGSSGGESSNPNGQTKSESGQSSGGYVEEVIHDGGSGETIVVPGYTLDDHGTWSETEISEDQARQMVKDLCDQVTSQVGVGKVPGKIAGAIKNLEEPIRNWKHELRQYVGRKYGGKRWTHSRQNRRKQQFGSKGKSSHASAPLTVCTDTSGSVDQKRLEQFYSEIESMSQRFKITQVQFDHGYQCHSQYHRGDWRELEIRGRGGTSFIELFKALDELDLWGRVTIVCTDGEAPWPEPRPGRDVLWVIFPHRPIEQAPKPPFGDVIYLER